MVNEASADGHGGAQRQRRLPRVLCKTTTTVTVSRHELVRVVCERVANNGGTALALLILFNTFCIYLRFFPVLLRPVLSMP